MATVIDIRLVWLLRDILKPKVLSFFILFL